MAIQWSRRPRGLFCIPISRTSLPMRCAPVVLVSVLLLLVGAAMTAAPQWSNRVAESDLATLTSNTPLNVVAVSALVVADVDLDGALDIALSGIMSSCGISTTNTLATKVFVRNGVQFSEITVSSIPTISTSYCSGLHFTYRPSAPALPHLLACSFNFFFAMENVGNGSFVDSTTSFFAAPPTNCSNGYVDGADFNNDGRADIIVASPHFGGFLFTYDMQANGSFVDSTSVRFSPVFLSTSVALAHLIADFNNDGRPDVIFTAPLTLYLGAANGTLVLTSNWLPVNFSIARLSAGDLNSDGFSDLVAIETNRSLVCLRNNKNASFSIGAFSYVDPLLGGGDVVVRDVSGDGNPDIVVFGTYISSAQGAAILRNVDGVSFVNDSLAFEIPMKTGMAVGFDFSDGLSSVLIIGSTTSSSKKNAQLITHSGSVIVDNTQAAFARSRITLPLIVGTVSMLNFYGGDTCPDLFLTGGKIDRYALAFSGDCRGTFSALPVAFPQVGFSGSQWADFDQDGRQDLFLSGLSATGFLYGFYVQNFDGNFIDISSTAIPNGSLPTANIIPSYDAQDLTGDGFPELLVAGIGPRVVVLRNLRNQTFSDDMSITEYAVVVRCIPRPTNDAIFDIYLHNFVSYSLYRNVFNGTFLNVTGAFPFSKNLPVPSSENPRMAFAFGDVNGDGLADMLVTGAEFLGSSWPSALLYLGQSNDSYHLSPVLHNNASLRGGGAVFADFDLDGDLDIAVSGTPQSDAIPSVSSMVVLRNDGGSFFELMTGFDISGYGYYSGNLAVASATSAYDDYPDLFAVGKPQICGIGFFANRVPVNLSLSSTGNPTPVLSSGSGGDTDYAALIGGIAGGGAGFFLLFACCIILCLCCCLLLIIVVVLVVLLLASALVAVVGVGAVIVVGGSSSGGVAALVMRRSKHRDRPPPFDGSNMSEAELRDAVNSISEVPIIQWRDVGVTGKLGAGAFGEVLRAEWHGVEVAVKVFRGVSDKSMLEDFRHEALMMARVGHHPNVVSLYGVSVNDDTVCLVMELCGRGSLLGALERGEVSSPSKIAAARQVAGALNFLHSLGVVHRDVAARNVLLDAAGKAMLADLGLSRVLDRGADSSHTASNVGPVRWMAPECISSREYSAASDAYAFGMLLVEIWTNGGVPFASYSSLADVAIAVVRQGAQPEVPDGMPLPVERLMRSMWAREPTSRPTMADAVRVLESAAASSEPSAVDGSSSFQQSSSESMSSPVYSVLERC